MCRVKGAKNDTYSLSTNSHHQQYYKFMNNLNKTFGFWVRHFRKMRSLSQEELADACNLHRTYIGGIERGERNVSLNNVERISDALGIPVTQLLANKTAESREQS